MLVNIPEIVRAQSANPNEVSKKEKPVRKGGLDEFKKQKAAATTFALSC